MSLLSAARPEDVEPFVELLERAAEWLHGRGIHQWEPGSMRAQTARFRRAQKRNELLVVRDGGRLVAGVCLTREPDPIWHDLPRDGARYLSRLVVERERAGHALGAMILAEAEQRARESAGEWLRLDCVAGNVSLERYYQSAGYAPCGVALAHGAALTRHEKRLVALSGPGVKVASLAAVDFERWRPDARATLLFLRRGGEVLLIHKKRGHGAGKVNGPGGKLHGAESPLEGAVRETLEEVGVQAEDAVAAAELRFQDTNGETLCGYVYVADRFRGDPVETAEARPFWCAVGALPFDEMWDDDRLWLPRVLEGDRVVGEFLMHDERLAEHRLRQIERLSF